MLRQQVNAETLSTEFDRAMIDAFEDLAHLNAGAIGNHFRYVPMMCEYTPYSLDLIGVLAPLAAELLGCNVLPGRAKATIYVGSAKWHRDTDLNVRSIGLAAYLEPLTASTGALQVIPGSHHPDYGTAIDSYLSDSPAIAGVGLPTGPGDLIVFNEHLFHATSGGGTRRQWRIDFVADDAPDDILTEWYARQYSVGWDAGYNLDRYPSYGPYWQTRHPHWNQRLTELGAYQAAHAEETAASR